MINTLDSRALNTSLDDTRHPFGGGQIGVAVDSSTRVTDTAVADFLLPNNRIGDSRPNNDANDTNDNGENGESLTRKLAGQTNQDSDVENHIDNYVAIKPQKTVARLETLYVLWHKHSWLTLIVAVLALVLGAISFAKTRPARPVGMQTTNLDAYEQQALAEVLDKLGKKRPFDTNLDEVYQAVNALSWVDDVNVARDWERGIMVSVIPKKPVASFGSERMLDAKGEVFYPANPNVLGDKNLAMLHSDDAYAYAAMRRMYQINEWFEPLGLMASDVILTSRQTWLIRFDNGMRVTVDHEGTDQKLYALSQNLKNPALIERLDGIDAVDLRYKNGFAIAWQDQEHADSPMNASRITDRVSDVNQPLGGI